MNALTVIEQTQLHDLEAVIERGLQTFFDVGSALGEIRSQRLYRASHETFEEYCNERWGMSRSYASRVIGAADAQTQREALLKTNSAYQALMQALDTLKEKAL